MKIETKRTLGTQRTGERDEERRAEKVKESQEKGDHGETEQTSEHHW